MRQKGQYDNVLPSINQKQYENYERNCKNKYDNCAWKFDGSAVAAHLEQYVN